MAVNLNILGFSHSTGGDVSLTSISHGSHRVCSGVVQNGDLTFRSITEPYHDSNKMYASIKGACSDVKFQVGSLHVCLHHSVTSKTLVSRRRWL